MSSDYRHLALTGRGHDAVVERFAGLLRRGLAQGELPLLLASHRTVTDVRDALTDAVDAVAFVVMDEHARNPSRVTSMLYRYGATAEGARVLGANELMLHGRTEAARQELVLGECVLNSVALQTLPMTVVCVADETTLDEAAALALRRCHPEVAGLSQNHDFDAAWATELHAAPLPAPPDAAEVLTVDARRLDVLRAFVHSVASGHGLAPDRVDDLVLAANEAVANSMRHGGGRATVHVWLDDGSLVCDVRDHGYVRDPMTGRLPPAATSVGGRGLWLIHHLCDLVQLRSSELTGTTVRLFVDR